MTTLLIARHGNTFAPGEKPRRVGRNTDLPLVASGQLQALKLGQYIKQHNIIPDVIYCSELQRTQQTAQGILEILQCNIPILIDDIFNEVDYGIDENKTEDEVIARLGKAALQAWDEHAIVPDGWQIDPNLVRQQWQGFAKKILCDYPQEKVLVVTSNGIARFAPSALFSDDTIAEFYRQHSHKIATGALCRLDHPRDQWQVGCWGVRP